MSAHLAYLPRCSTKSSCIISSCIFCIGINPMSPFYVCRPSGALAPHAAIAYHVQEVVFAVRVDIVPNALISWRRRQRSQNICAGREEIDHWLTIHVPGEHLPEPLPTWYSCIV